MIEIIFLISLIPAVAYIAYTICGDLHMVQLNSYRIQRYGKWVLKNPRKYLIPRNLIPFLAFPAIIFCNHWGFFIVWSLSYLLLFLLRDKNEAKILLKFTSRAKRLFLAIVSIYTLIIIIALSNYSFTHDLNDIYIVAGFLSIFTVLSFIPTMAGCLMNMPLEKVVEQWYYKDAQKKIRSFPNLTVIGITGSFGKTSTKFILNDIISSFFNTLMTPKSFNTKMGVTKVVRENLRPIHQIFIVEMGARQKGDIEDICELVHLKIGILTAIGEQHLETFKSLDTIKNTKSELIESLPDDGIAILNGDDVNIRSLSFRKKRRTLYFGIDSPKLDYFAHDIEVTPKGVSFVVGNYRGEEAKFQTKLLGKHNIYNILAALSVACELGLELRDLANKVRILKPAPHRLEIRKSPGNITVIDDSFSSNPVGAKMALDVLGRMTGKRKILITPGMVELGSKEYEYNKNFGFYAAAVCHVIILVGQRQTLPVQEGLALANYPTDSIYIAADLKGASVYLKSIAQSGDVVLFENDLPDNYI